MSGPFEFWKADNMRSKFNIYQNSPMNKFVRLVSAFENGALTYIKICID
jgi:hypothetical protein